MAHGSLRNRVSAVVVCLHTACLSASNPAILLRILRNGRLILMLALLMFSSIPGAVWAVQTTIVLSFQLGHEPACLLQRVDGCRASDPASISNASVRCWRV